MGRAGRSRPGSAPPLLRLGCSLPVCVTCAQKTAKKVAERRGKARKVASKVRGAAAGSPPRVTRLAACGSLTAWVAGGISGGGAWERPPDHLNWQG